MSINKLLGNLDNKNNGIFGGIQSWVSSSLRKLKER